MLLRIKWHSLPPPCPCTHHIKRAPHIWVVSQIINKQLEWYPLPRLAVARMQLSALCVSYQTNDTPTEKGPQKKRVCCITILACCCFSQGKQTSRFMFAGQTIFSRANKPTALCLQGKRFFQGQTNQPLHVCRANDLSHGKNTNPFMFAGQTILARAKIPTPLCL